MADSMNENVIEFLRDSKTATVTLCQGRYISRIKAYAEKYPDECQILFENADGSILAHVPTRWVHITRHSGHEFSEEQKNANIERLKSYRQRH